MKLTISDLEDGQHLRVVRSEKWDDYISTLQNGDTFDFNPSTINEDGDLISLGDAKYFFSIIQS